MANPLVPAAYDVWWSVAVFVVLALLGAALVSIARTSKSLTPVVVLVWTLVVLFVPVVGPVSWFAIGRPSALTKTPTDLTR